MSDAIKAGDLVMVVRPTLCCGVADYIGYVFVAAEVSPGLCRCRGCGHVHNFLTALDAKDGQWVHLSRLKKIDPPAIGDDLPTRADLDIPEPACP